MGQGAEAGINDAPHSVLAALMMKVRLCIADQCLVVRIRGFTLASCVVM